MSVFLPLITGLISSGAETEQRVIRVLIIHTASIYRKHTLKFNTKALFS